MENVVPLYTYVANVLEKFHHSKRPLWGMTLREIRANRFALQMQRMQQHKVLD